MISFRAFLLASGVGAIGAVQAAALTFDNQPPLRGMIAEATLAFRGTVEAIDYGATALSQGNSVPYENIHMRVRADFGGAAAGQITLRQIGGRLPGEQTKFLVIPGLADLVPGEDVYIFANDRVQPFFATIYGDASLVRVATDETGSVAVLNAFWQPLVAGNDAIWPEQGVRCLPLKDDRSRCVRTEAIMHDHSDEEDTERRSGQPLTPAMVDRFIRRWRDADMEPGQTVSADEATFEKALAAFAGPATAEPGQD